MAYRNIYRTLLKPLNKQDQATLAGRGRYKVPLMTYQDRRTGYYDAFRCLWCGEISGIFTGLEDHVAMVHMGLSQAQVEERRGTTPRIEVRSL